MRVELVWSRGLSEMVAGGSPTSQAKYVPLWRAPDAPPTEPAFALLHGLTDARAIVKAALYAAKAHADFKAQREGAKKARRA